MIKTASLIIIKSFCVQQAQAENKEEEMHKKLRKSRKKKRRRKKRGGRSQQKPKAKRQKPRGNSPRANSQLDETYSITGNCPCWAAKCSAVNFSLAL
jgi:hypothetical protein